LRIRKKDTDEFVADESSIVRHFLPADASFSITFLRVEGTHENSSEAEIAYYVLEGEGIIKKNGKIEELEEEDVFYVGRKNHTLEGGMKLLAVRSPPSEHPEEQL